MNFRKWILLICWLSVVNTAWAHDLTPIVTLRSHGYTLGDAVHMVVKVPLQADERLDESSLPLEGRVNNWMDLQHVHAHVEARHLVLELTWQLFATVEIAQALRTPTLQLKLKGAQARNQARKVDIPAQAFYYSPVLPHPLPSNLLPFRDLPPVMHSPRTAQIATILLMGMGTLALVLWAWVSNRLPWLPFKVGPLTIALRTLKKGRAIHLSREECLVVHQALNACAQQTLYPKNLPVLFAQASYLQPFQQNIEHFFMQSWPSFYQEELSPQIHRDHTLAWLKQASVAEHTVYLAAPISVRIRNAS